MQIWNFFHNEDHQEVKKLVGRLKEFSNIKMGRRDERKLKMSILQAIQQAPSPSVELLPSPLRRLADSISSIGKRTQLSMPQKMRLKNAVMAFVKRASVLKLAFVRFPNMRFLKIAVSSALLFLFVVTTIFLFPLQVPLTYASHSTYFEDVQGQVYVLRDGSFLAASKDFSLQEADVVITKDNSSATIRFFDDSVSRLDSNTQLELKRLYTEPFNPVATQVELLMEDGHMWARVLNLVDNDAHFMVSTSRAVAIVTKKAAFDLQSHLYVTTLSVFDNVVDFASGNTFPLGTKPVLAGFQAEVSQENGAGSPTIVPVAEGIQGNAKIAHWIESNMEKDKIHTEAVVAENEQTFVDNSTIADVLQKPSDVGGDKPLSNPAIEQHRQQFLDAYKRLLLGETYFMRQQEGEGIQLVVEFENVVRMIQHSLNKLMVSDPLNVDLLHSFMEAKIGQQKKDLATLLPGDPLYPVKEQIEETELLLAGSDVERTQIQFSQMEDKLIEIQDLIGSAKFDQAGELLKRYQRQVDSLTLKVNSSNAGEFNEKLVSLLDQEVDQIKELTSIEKSLFESQENLITEVRKLRGDALEKLMGAFEAMKDYVPVKLVQELKDLLQTYLDNGAADHEFVDMLNKILLKYDRSGSSSKYSDSTKLPSSLGMVMIVEEDATPSSQSLENTSSDSASSGDRGTQQEESGGTTTQENLKN